MHACVVIWELTGSTLSPKKCPILELKMERVGRGGRQLVHFPSSSPSFLFLTDAVLSRNIANIDREEGEGEGKCTPSLLNSKI